MTLPRSRHACPANPNSELRPRRRSRFFNRYSRGRMRRAPCVRARSARADLDDVRDAVPFAIKLADLLLIHFERERDLMVVLSRFRLHHGEIERAAGSRVQNTHQRSLRVAIANVESLHRLAPWVCLAGVSPAVRQVTCPPSCELLCRFVFQ